MTKNIFFFKCLTVLVLKFFSHFPQEIDIYT